MFRTTAWTSSLSLQWRYGINQCERLLRVIAVCTGELDSQRNSVSVANQVTLAAELGSVSGIRPRLLPPKTARIELLSTIARDQSIFP